MYTNFTNGSWNLSIWNQSHLFSSSSSSSLVVTQFEGTNYNVYVILKHYITIPILIVSILCIIVTLITVTRRGLWRTTVTYIVVLAIVDLFTLLSLCILSMDYFIIPALPEGLYTRMYHLIETILDELVDTLLLISNWLTVLIATERYFAVCHPLKVRFIDRRYRRIFIFFVILTSILIRLPGFIILGFRTEINLPYILVLFRKLYIWIVQIILLLIIPFSILTFVNIRLIQTVRYSSHLIKRRYKRSKKETSVTSNSVKSEAGLLQRIQSCCCCISSHRCHTLKCKIFCCNSLNLKTDRVNSCHLHSLHQQNGSNIIMNKSELLQATDLSPINSPTGLTASEPTGAQIGRSHREEKKITITLVCLIITFFICQGPFVLTTVIMSYSDSQLYRSDTSTIINNTLLFFKMYTDKSNVETETVIKPFDAVHYINSISIIALALKSDLSFFFYCWFCDRFLFALKKMMHYNCLRRSRYHHHHHHYRHNYYHNQQQQHHNHHHHHHNHHHQHGSHNQTRQKHILCNSHPQLQKFTKPRHNQEIIELNMPSGGSLLPDYQLPHHHYKYGGEYYQYRIPSDMSSSQQKVLRYKKPAPLPFNLSKHKRIPVINLPMNSKFSWSSPSCSDNSHKCSSPKKRSSSLGPSKGRVKSLNSLKMNM
ncbi:unnamed protein product [Trichobilharzia szidati]|nr:unnamed protein product [Trichobilharzia szidati]